MNVSTSQSNATVASGTVLILSSQDLRTVMRRIAADFDPTLNKITAVAAAAVPAALVAWFVSTRVLRIGVLPRK
jgi:hypothetical protein